MFHTELALDKADDMKNAFFDVLCRMKRDNLELKIASLDPSDLQGLIQLTEERKKLEKMQASGAKVDAMDCLSLAEQADSSKAFSFSDPGHVVGCLTLLKRDTGPEWRSMTLFLLG